MGIRDGRFWQATWGLRNRMKRGLRRSGFDVVSYNDENIPLLRRMNLLRKNRIGLVLDVGANVGQYATQLRDGGYQGRIVSFEPLAQAFAKLQQKAAADDSWSVVNVALGSSGGSQTIHQGGPDGACSSILDMLPSHERIYPESRYTGAETIQVVRLDDVLDQYAMADERIYLKIDVQGFEHEVLAGAARSLPRIIGLQVELSTVPLYAGSRLFPELCQQFYEEGFELVSTELAQLDFESSRVTQYDGVFYRPVGS